MGREWGSRASLGSGISSGNIPGQLGECGVNVGLTQVCGTSLQIDKGLWERGFTGIGTGLWGKGGGAELMSG